MKTKTIDFFENELKLNKDKSKEPMLKMFVKLSKLSDDTLKWYADYLDEKLANNIIFQTNKKYLSKSKLKDLLKEVVIELISEGQVQIKQSLVNELKISNSK